MDTLYYNGVILTGNTFHPMEAVLCRDGKIAGIGRLSSFDGLPAKRVNLQGKTMLPGFIDSHSHITAYASTLRLCSLAHCKSIGELIRALADFAGRIRLAQGQWILGFGYDHNNLVEKRHPLKDELDEVSAGSPVLITHASGHMGVVNSRGLQELGIDKDSKAPEGGVVGRDKKGRLTGYLEENAFMQVSSAIPLPSEEQVEELIQKAQQDYFSYGITTAQEGMLRSGEFETLSRMAQKGLLELDVVGYADMKNAPQLYREHPEYREYQNHFRLGGYKIFLDGSPQGRTAWMTESYEGSPDYKGYPIYEDQQVAAFLRQAKEDDAQILAHCNGDAAAAQYLSAAKAVGGLKRPVMIHAQLLRTDQLAQLKALNMIPSFFVAHTYYWGDTHLKNFGKKRGGHISPLRDAAAAGLPFTLHQDTPVIQPDMIETVWCAVNRYTRSGVSIGADQRVSCAQALLGVTANAAYQYFEEQHKGTIDVGKQADFVILSGNPLAVYPEAIRDIRVEATIKGDRTVYERRS